MSTTRRFQAMLNEYLPNKLLKEEMIKRDYILKTVPKDDSWKSGNYIVPFKGAGASSIKMGGLTAANDISQSTFVRGQVPEYKEMWGSLIFNHRDLMEHGEKGMERSFINLLVEELPDFMDKMKSTASIQMGTGPQFATVTKTAGGSEVNGEIRVDRVDRFDIGQKIQVHNANTGTPVTHYVSKIDINRSSLILLSATKSVINAKLSGATVGSKVYTDGAQGTGTRTLPGSGSSATFGDFGNAFTSLSQSLLTTGAGGTANLHGITKTDYPYLQCINQDGSAFTKANILDSLLDFWVKMRNQGAGAGREILVSYTVGAAILKAVENTNNASYRGNFDMDKKGKVAQIFGWDEIWIHTIRGSFKVVMLQEWDTDKIVFWDPNTCKFASNGMFQKRKSPDGTEFFEIRNTSGYQYICDISLFGEFIVQKPKGNGIIHSVDATKLA